MEMTNTYFSEKELGENPRVETSISVSFWGSIVAIIDQQINNGAFGYNFPDKCPDDDGGIIGTHTGLFARILLGEIPQLAWPLDSEIIPQTVYVMDLLEFCHANIAKPKNGNFHTFYGKYHLDFDIEGGQLEFRNRINHLFSRNGLAFEMQVNGKIKRMVPKQFESLFEQSFYNTGDLELDRMLETAKIKFLNPDLNIRKESIEKLWDAWERAKTLLEPNDKKMSIKKLLNTISPEPNFRRMIEDEATELTSIGNNFMIRHTEINKPPIETSIQVDFLFFRMFAFLNMIFTSMGHNVTLKSDPNKLKHF
jgi:hypothetical protein